VATFGASQQHEIFWFSDYKRLPAVFWPTHTQTHTEELAQTHREGEIYVGI